MKKRVLSLLMASAMIVGLTADLLLHTVPDRNSPSAGTREGNYLLPGWTVWSSNHSTLQAVYQRLHRDSAQNTDPGLPVYVHFWSGCPTR